MPQWSRCGERPDALHAPNFVGTFDGFINRYITKPLYVQEYGRTPHFLETWQGVKAASFRVTADRVPNFELGWFSLDGQLGATLIEDWIPRKTLRALRPIIKAQRAAAERRAGGLCRSLIKRGLISCAASRALAMGYLTDPQNEKRIGRLLANRFREVIVDEAQDCGPEELSILRLLRRFEISVVAVADLDQSIFEFRRAERALVHAFKDELPGHLPLSGNFRSSPAICALNNSLRSGSYVETAVGDNANCPLPVQLLEFHNLSNVATAVADVLDMSEVPHEDAIVLAHARKDAREAAGAQREEAGQGGGAISGIAAAHAVFTASSSTPAERSRAIRRVESTLRDIAGFEDQTESTLDERWLRDTAIRLTTSLDPSRADAKTYADQVRRYVREIRWPEGITPSSDLGILRAPTQDKWPAHDEVNKMPIFASATIHSAKGHEGFPGVAVVLPQKLTLDAKSPNVLDHWEQGMASEARRVLYVGASRAQRLLILSRYTPCTETE